MRKARIGNFMYNMPAEVSDIQNLSGGEWQTWKEQTRVRNTFEHLWKKLGKNEGLKHMSKP